MVEWLPRVMKLGSSRCRSPNPLPTGLLGFSDASRYYGDISCCQRNHILEQGIWSACVPDAFLMFNFLSIIALWLLVTHSSILQMGKLSLQEETICWKSPIQLEVELASPGNTRDSSCFDSFCNLTLRGVKVSISCFAEEWDGVDFQVWHIQNKAGLQM